MRYPSIPRVSAWSPWSAWRESVATKSRAMPEESQVSLQLGALQILDLVDALSREM